MQPKMEALRKTEIVSIPYYPKLFLTVNAEYPAHLVIYNAGDMRSSFVSFFKATAIFQFGLVAVFLSPVLYHNEKQPDPNIRLLQAVGCKFRASPCLSDTSPSIYILVPASYTLSSFGFLSSYSSHISCHHLFLFVHIIVVTFLAATTAFSKPAFL